MWVLMGCNPSEYKQTYYLINPEGAALKSSPNNFSSNITVLNYMSCLQVIKEKKAASFIWLYVTSGNKKGWLNSSDVSTNKPQPNLHRVLELIQCPFSGLDSLNLATITDSSSYFSGVPFEISSQVFTNQYNESLDFIYTIQSAGLKFKAYYITEMDKEIVYEINISSDAYRMKYLKLGMEQQSIFKKLGPPSLISNQQLYYGDEESDAELVLSLSDSRLASVEIIYNLD